MNTLQAYFLKILHNPVWYVAVVAGLALLTNYVGFQWWLAAVVASVWGVWLVSSLFSSQEPDEPMVGADHLQAYVDQTQAYQRQIGRVIQMDHNQFNQFHLQQLATQLDTCSQAVGDLVERLSLIQQDSLIQKDLQTVPTAIARLEQRLNGESTPELNGQLQQLLALRRHQYGLLQRLEIVTAQTELQLEHTLSLLGTIYSQILISQSTNDMADYGRISASMDEEMRCLSDRLEALREVKGAYWLVGKTEPSRAMNDHHG